MQVKFILLLLLSIPLFSNNSELVDYKACFLSNSKALYNQGDNYCLAIEKNKKICHTPTQYSPYTVLKGEKLLKVDPYLRLNLIETTEKLHPVSFKSLFNYKIGDEVALIDEKRYVLANISNYSNGLEVQSQLSQNRLLGKVLGVKCYKAIGFGSTDNTFISSDILLKFAYSKGVHYGDIGIRLVKNSNNKILVEYRDLFFENNPFLVGDEILAVGETKAVDLHQISRKILDLPYHKDVTVTIRRNGKILKVISNVKKRYGGGYLPDLFVERFGLFFDDQFKLINVHEDTIIGKKLLREGDRLLQIDRMKVEDIHSLKRYISEKKERRTTLLFERDGFQFFLILE